MALQDLWAYASEERPSGDLSGFSNELLALAVDWEGDCDRLFAVLQEVKLLDGEPGGWILHDWEDHQPWVVEREVRLAKNRRNASKGGFTKAHNNGDHRGLPNPDCHLCVADGLANAKAPAKASALPPSIHPNHPIQPADPSSSPQENDDAILAVERILKRGFPNETKRKNVKGIASALLGKFPLDELRQSVPAIAARKTAPISSLQKYLMAAIEKERGSTLSLAKASPQELPDGFYFLRDAFDEAGLPDPTFRDLEHILARNIEQDDLIEAVNKYSQDMERQEKEPTLEGAIAALEVCHA